MVGIWLCCMAAISCNRPSSLGKVLSEQPSFSAADSLAMAEKFDAALKDPERMDSILVEADALRLEKPGLSSVYNTSYARFLILTGKLDEPRRQALFLYFLL